MTADKCFEGWKAEDGNKAGRCCCNCVSQVAIHKHPWNSNELMKGSVMEIAGWGCNTDLQQPGMGIIFFERQHSMCEMHDFKKD